MDKNKFIARVKAEADQLDPDTLQERIKDQIALKPHGRKETDVKDWTISALRDVLKKKRKAECQEEKQREEQRRKEAKLQEKKKLITDAHNDLRDVIQEGGWKDIKDTLSSHPSKSDLLQAIEGVILRDIEDVTPNGVNEGTDNIPSLSSIQLIPRDDCPDSLPLSAEVTTDLRATMFSAQPRTREWSAVEIGSKVAFARSVKQQTASSNSIPPNQYANILRNAFFLHEDIAWNILVEMGQKLTETIESIQRAIPEQAKQDENAYWEYIFTEWPSIQLRLDNTITMLPPRSRQEAIDRVYRYLDALQRTQNFGYTMKKSTREKIVPLADAMFRSIPRKLDLQTVSTELSHYDPQLLQNPGITPAREGEEIVFVAPRTSFESAPLRDSDLQLSMTSDPLITKQRVASLVSEYDGKTYNQDEWVSGRFLSPEELTVSRTKHQYVDGVRAIQSKLGDIIPQGLDADLINARWFLDKPGALFERNTMIQCRVIPQNKSLLLGIPRINTDQEWMVLASDSAHPLWRGIAAFSAHHRADTNSTQRFDAGYAKIALHPMVALHPLSVDLSERKKVLEHLANSIQSPNDTLDPWLTKMSYIGEVMKLIDRSITRVPAKSLPELMTRFALARTMWNQYKQSTALPIVADDKDIQFAKEALWELVPKLIIPSSDADLGALTDTLGIDTSILHNIHFLREGPRKMSFICRRNDVPTHPLFHRSHESDEERILDLVVASDESLDETIESERGKWVSGTLPTVKELEDEYLSHVQVDDKVIEEATPLEKSAERKNDGIGSASGTNESREQIAVIREKMRIIRNVLLRMSVQGSMKNKPIYAYNNKNGNAGYDIGAEDTGKTVIQIPDSALTIIVIPGAKTRVVLNADMDPDAFKNLSASEIDTEYGKRELTFSDAEQFTRVIQGYIGQRLDPRQRAVNYPVGFEKNPSPLRTLPNAPSKDFLLAIFRRISEVCGGKALGALTLGDVRSIASGPQWPLGSNTHGHTLLMNIWRELPEKVTSGLTLDTTIQDEDYRKLRALFDYLKPIVVEHLANTEPTEGRVDAVQSITQEKVVGITDTESTT